MNSRPLLLDLFCCQGGASAGYADAGFDVIGVDIEPQPRYPYPFAQGDAVAVARAVARLGFVWLAGLGIVRPAAIHASPPCQGKTNAQKIQQREHPKLIAPVRAALERTGLPYVIENVPPMPGLEDDDPLKDPVELCGLSFGLRTYRHRQFETNWVMAVPEHMDHSHRQIKMGRPLAEGDFYQAVGNFSNVDYVRRDLNAPWMNRDGLRESIPRAYAEHVGIQLIERITLP